MSKYEDSKFMEPSVSQYGSHMVMTNVMRPTKHKYINFDTKYRDDSNSVIQKSAVNVNITLPERINEVKSMHVRSVELPVMYFNISAARGNHCFVVSIDSVNTVIRFPDGDYTPTTLSAAINAAIDVANLSLVYSYNTTTLKSSFAAIESVMDFVFNVDANGNPVSFGFKNTLGWILGFRNTSYTITDTPTVSENMIDLTPPKYFYLVIDEFSKGVQSSFVCPQNGFLLRKNVIAKLALCKSHYPFGTVLTANNYNGLLLSDKRSYTGKIDIQKINVQLVDETGAVVDLNGGDISFCVEVEHE
jgi:hypothetical protein